MRGPHTQTDVVTVLAFGGNFEVEERIELGLLSCFTYEGTNLGFTLTEFAGERRHFPAGDATVDFLPSRDGLFIRIQRQGTVRLALVFRDLGEQNFDTQTEYGFLGTGQTQTLQQHLLGVGSERFFYQSSSMGSVLTTVIERLVAEDTLGVGQADPLRFLRTTLHQHHDMRCVNRELFRLRIYTTTTDVLNTEQTVLGRRVDDSHADSPVLST